ncbi:asparaginase [Streptomyces rapamycinicus]|uniref:asparaginase n=2 Tax=Streptomyces rapamycinicus TaxID=1226757 RepID=A0A0A0NFC8_STRRN|nr:asparaginase [Streptomyces rapamycinicus]AGP53135.1 asparaginase [Streptomyces rapamycinicus NRRL 5491]MBB4780619.1 L-asparaginase [Streptomyces rapamycinicus]RLV74730.1 L-asparaginase [Streptomyces rapamycinicus NRRL 5491]UTO61331.1 asparaginase [Streptomyces rapamycinicus]UTP29278.1 asparaginase [Streptomyces rapamycinicus NRRL 5491]
MAQLARRSGVLITLMALALGTTTTLAGAAEPIPRPTPKVAVIGTGGTIAGVSRTKVSFDDYQAGKLPVSRLVNDLGPEVNRIADVTTQQFGNKDSNNYTIPEYRRLTAAVDHALKFNDGVVVTTGTDTMEEFAYWLDLTVRSDKPVVLTGAMRPWTVIGSDAPANLYNAIHLAASGRTTCFGTVVMLNDQIHAAREVRKSDTLRLNAFSSGSSGELGVIDQNHIRVNRAPARVEQCGKPGWKTPFNLDRIARRPLPKVDIAYSYQGAGPQAIKAFADAGAAGIVTAGTGAGGLSPAMTEARDDAVKNGVVMVSASRTGSGAVYDPDVRGVIGAQDLTPQKARLLLLLSLATSHNEHRIQSWFHTFGTGEFTARR